MILVPGKAWLYRRGRVWWLKYGPRGKRRRETLRATDREEAVRVGLARLSDALAGFPQHSADLRFDSLVRMMLDDAAIRGLRAISSLRSSLSALGRHFGNCRVSEIDRAALLRYAAERQKAAASSTVYDEIKILRRALALARENGYRVEVPKPLGLRQSPARRGFFEDSEWSAIRKRLRPELQDVGDFAYWTGWRLMEVLTLQERHVDTRAQIVRLDPGSTKTGAGRVFPYGAVPGLRAVVERRLAVIRRLRARGVLTPWLFCFEAPFVDPRGQQRHQSGEPLFGTSSGPRSQMLSSLRRAWTRACGQVGYPAKLIHDFRRTAARNMERAGLTRSEAMMLGGWQSELVFRRYAIADEADLWRAAARLNAPDRGTVRGTVRLKTPGFGAVSAPAIGPVGKSEALKGGNHVHRRPRKGQMK